MLSLEWDTMAETNDAVTLKTVVSNKGTVIKISTACISQNSWKTFWVYHGEYCLFANWKLCSSGIRPVMYIYLECMWNTCEPGKLAEHVLLCWHMWHFFPSYQQLWGCYCKLQACMCYLCVYSILLLSNSFILQFSQISKHWCSNVPTVFYNNCLFFKANMLCLY
jgi:hypothetical protein